MLISRHIKRLTLVSTSVAALLGGAVIASSSADLQGQINASKSTAAALQSQINSEATQIEQTRGGLAAAQAKLSSVQAALDTHIAQLRDVQTNLMTARDELLALEDKLHLAAKYLEANLRSAYENGSPNLVDVILNAHGFSSLLDQVNYIKDAQSRDDQIVQVTRIARARVQKEALHLYSLEIKDRNLTNDILAQRNQEALIQAALLKQQLDEQSAQSHSKARLANVNAQTTKLQKQYAAQVAAAQAAAAAAAAARAAAAQKADQATQAVSQQASEQVNQQAGGVAINSGGTVSAPAGAPSAVVAMIAAGNAIATLPYIWGGGHASFQALGYDCSGSVSFVLNAGGMLSSPEVSGWFESYGDAGPGQWVTIYANAGHVWMTIANWRFDTVALAEDGTRWSQGGGEYAGFVVRHPVGL
jgi:peptidoglycan hydrolase CwlO-like protein